MDYPKIAFFYEVDQDRIPTSMMLMDALVAAWDCQYLAIDRSGNLKKNPFIFHSLTEAREAYDDHAWYFFYPNDLIPEGMEYFHLEEMDHPDERKIVYAVGSNTDGFNLSPDQLNLRPQDRIVTMGKPGSNLWNAVAVCAIAYDRWQKAWRNQD